jgi:predicted nucleic acid-binding protein
MLSASFLWMVEWNAGRPGNDWRCSTQPPPVSANVSVHRFAERVARKSVAGRVRSCTGVAALVDTNILVYRYDSRFPDKQKAATDLLRDGIADGSLRIAHQAIVEFVAVVSRPLGNDAPLLSAHDARREAEEFLLQFDCLYPNDALVRLALRGMAAYQLEWFDAHMWAYAEQYGLEELITEDFQHARTYGTVRIRNPFHD